MEKHAFIPPVVLVFAASDPTCGAGIQADILTIARLGGHPATVLTALTVQDTAGVAQVVPVGAALVREQAQAILEDMPIAALKLGVLGSAENATMIARLVTDFLARHPEVPLVVDPVLASGRGDALADAQQQEILRETLLPLAALLTPNLPEARAVLRTAISPASPPSLSCARPTERQALAEGLLALGPRHVLLTGTHDATDDVVNSLYSREGLIREDRWPRLPESYHGSGCTLASAIAAKLARGMALEAAVRTAEEFVWQSLAHGYQPGKGQYVPQRLFGIANEATCAVEQSLD
ncbi:MAG: hydroxymethylpyrimidine/phosphomethylpyrimidine kinase [Zoogloeaceae bacterium]|jgi:hydroxymethylpyrimidine/phosphomethylpyrimidine kinase|nr:hydroxymethylpyrimidine/phosphomethylpyrimidine kinase [Zoogloeaceae bacterium]